MRLEALEVGEGAVVGAVEGGEAPLEAEEVFFGAVPADDGGVWMVERVVVGAAPTLDFVVPEEGLDVAEATEEPIGVDEGVDGGLFAGADGPAGDGVFAGEVVESFGGFAVDEEGLGVGAGLEGVAGRGGFAGDGGGSGRLLRIATIRFDLSLGGHAGFGITR